MDIDRFIIDKYFDIYNRNGFDYMISQIQSPFKIYLLDFDNVKKMNNDIGYIKVNNIFKELFTKLKNKYLIGRAFSGDEIFFVTQDLDDDINYIREICNEVDLNFKWIEAKNLDLDIHIDIFLEKIIENFR